jgi:hypothetical protein
MVYPVSRVTGEPSVFVVGGTQVSVAVPVPVVGVTVTVALCAAEPPSPLQVSLYVVVAVSAEVVLKPLVGSLPVQPPEAVQEVALVDDQVSVVMAPLATVLGLAEKVTAGSGVVTETVVACTALPPDPVQARVNLVVVVSVEVVLEPLVGSLPVQPPEAVQEVALVDDQVSVVMAPLATVLGLAEKVTAGSGVVTETVVACTALPPDPVQVSV